MGTTGISAYQCGAGTFAHEIGHNFGAHHDRANAGDNVNLPINAYNFGFVCGGAGTIMSYVGSPRLSHYSDPALTSGGQPCGVAFDQPNGAHNGHAIEVMRVQIEALRAPQIKQGTVRLANAAFSMREDDGGVDITVTRDGDLTRVVSVEVATVDETAEEQLDYLPVLGGSSSRPDEAGKSCESSLLTMMNTNRTKPFAWCCAIRSASAWPERPWSSRSASEDLDRGKAEFESDGVSVWENGGPITVNVNRTGTTTHELTIGYSTPTVARRRDQQYQSVSGTLTFAAGEPARRSPFPSSTTIVMSSLSYQEFCAQPVRLPPRHAPHAHDPCLQ